MAQVCFSCGRKPAFGQSRSHSMRATKRRFEPNLQKIRIVVDGTPRREYVCTRCIKAGKVAKHVRGASRPVTAPAATGPEPAPAAPAPAAPEPAPAAPEPAAAVSDEG